MNIERLEAELAELSQNYDSDRRSRAAVAAVALANKLAEADEFDDGAYRRAYDVAIELDRVGR